MTHYWKGDTWVLRKNLSNIYERVYIMGIKHNRLTEDMQKKLLSRIVKREWESITPTEQPMEVEEEPSNNAPSPGQKRKRTEVSGSSSSGGSSKMVKPSTEEDAIDGSTNASSSGGSFSSIVSLVKSFANKP